MLENISRDFIREKVAAPDYSSDAQLKKLVNDTFKDYANRYDDIRGSSLEFGLRGSIAKKRKNAILASMDRVRKEYGRLHVRSIEESFTQFEAISFETYQHVDAMCSIVAGASIWILDQLKKNGNLHKSFDYMPSESMDIYDADIPFSICHPSYEFELILSVSHMIINRNGSVGLLGEGKKRDENFDKLLSLIDQERFDHACRMFKEKQWDIIGRVMKLTEFTEEEEEKIVRRLTNNITPSPLMITKEPRMSKEDALDLADRADEIHQNLRWIETDLANHLYMNRKELVRSVGNRYGAEILQGFTIDDPYELCMALIILLDSGSDAPWLMRSGTTVMQCATKMLPWYPFFEDDDIDPEYDDEYDEVHFNRNDWINQPDEPVLNDPYHTWFGKKNLAQIIYQLSCGVLPFNMHPFAKDRKNMIEKGMDETVADKIESISEVFFFDDFQTPAVNLRRNWLSRFDSDQAEEETEATEEIEAGDPVSEEPDEPEIDAAAELRKARMEIKNLRKALSEISKEANADKIKLEHELKTLRQEHRELADLRAIVFNRDQGLDEEKSETNIEFPYSVQKRTVIFGGHDAFLKTLRKLIPDAKYIDVDNYSFSPEIVRNADVVWVQNNYISHAQYGKILSITRQYGIQLRYFTYSSAEKSAQQLAEEDQNKVNQSS